MAVVQTQPTVIRKSFVGLVLIYLFGILAVGILGVAALYLSTTQHDFAILLLIMAIVVAIVTLLQAYVYNLSRIVITAEQLDVVNWTSIINQNNAVCEWHQVEDIDFKKSGILGLLFDYGTLLIQTAGTERNLRITMVPRVEHARDYMAALADSAPTLVHEE